MAQANAVLTRAEADLSRVEKIYQEDPGAISQVVIDKNRQDYVFGTAQTIDAVDWQQMRAGGVLMNGGANVESSTVATVTLRASKDASGTFQVNVAKGQETFLRDSTAASIPVAIGQVATITVSDRETPSRVNKRKGR